MKLGKTLTTTPACGLLAFGALPALAEEEGLSSTLFTNVDVFDGFSPDPVKAMTSGLIDMHQHVVLNPPEGAAPLATDREMKT